MSEGMTLGDMLFDIRSDSGVSPHDVAKKLKCEFLTYKQFEWGARLPSAKQLREILAVLGASDKADELIALLNESLEPYVLTGELLLECVRSMSSEEIRQLVDLLGIEDRMRIRMD